MPKSSLKHETCLLVEHETYGKETAQMARTQFTDKYQLKKSSKKISAKIVVRCGYWLAGDNVMLTMLL